MGSSSRIGRSHITPIAHHSSSRIVHSHHGSVGSNTIYHNHIYSSPSGNRIYNGSSGNIVNVSPLSIFVVIAIIIASIFSFISCGTIASSKSTVEEIADSYAHYQEVIKYAEVHTEYQKTGEIIGIYYDNTYGKYCIKYKVEVDVIAHLTREITEYTFYIYDKDEINNYKVGDEILIACNAEDTADTINMDYKNSTLEDDGEYSYYLKKSKSNKSIIICVSIIGGLLIIVVIVKLVKKQKKDSKFDTEAFNKVMKDPYCEYCGSKLPQGVFKCTNCGASNNKK